MKVKWSNIEYKQVAITCIRKHFVWVNLQSFKIWTVVQLVCMGAFSMCCRTYYPKLQCKNKYGCKGLVIFQLDCLSNAIIKSPIHISGAVSKDQLSNSCKDCKVMREASARIKGFTSPLSLPACSQCITKHHS